GCPVSEPAEQRDDERQVGGAQVVDDLDPHALGPGRCDQPSGGGEVGCPPGAVRAWVHRVGAVGAVAGHLRRHHVAGRPGVVNAGTGSPFGRATGPRSAPGPSLVTIYVADADGSHVTQLTRPPRGYEDHLPTWSPDGRTIAFQR